MNMFAQDGGFEHILTAIENCNNLDVLIRLLQLIAKPLKKFDTQWAMDFTRKVFSIVERKLTNPIAQIATQFTPKRTETINDLLFQISHAVYKRNKSYKKDVREWIDKISFGVRLV